MSYDPELPAGYQEADIEMAELTSTANEIEAHKRHSKGGKAIDTDARTGLKWIVENTWDGSLTLAMTIWLDEAGYDASTDEANDAIFQAMFA